MTGNMAVVAAAAAMMEMAMQRKRLELRVAYMEHLHTKGNEDALTEVALSVPDLRRWLADAKHEARDHSVAIGSLIVRHLKVMPLGRDDSRAARALSVELLSHLATDDDAISAAARVAVALFDGDVHALVETLVSLFGARLEDDETQLWRMLIAVRHALGFAPQSIDHDDLLYRPTSSTHDVCGFDRVRLADLINEGLGSAIAGCRIEAVRVLRGLVVYLQPETSVRVLEILLDAATEEPDEEAGQFMLAIVWEIAFLRPQLAQAMLPHGEESRPVGLWSTLRVSSPRLRRVSVHGALRAIVHAKKVEGFELELLLRVVEIYASGTEQDAKCQKLMFDFFEDNLGKAPVHQGLVANAVLKGTRDAFLAGVPLPAARDAGLSQARQVNEEALLHRRNKLLMATLNEKTTNEVIERVKLMLRNEFSSIYSAKRIAEVIGATARSKTSTK